MSRSPLRATRRRVVGGLLVSLAVAFVANSTSSQAADPTATAIQNGLNQFATATQGLANVADTDTPDHLAFLTGKIPFSKLTPLANGGLALSNLLQQSFNNLPPGALNDPGALASALNSRDTTLANGVHVTLGCGDGGTGCGHAVAITPTAGGAPAYDLTLPFAATRVADVPIALPADAADLSGPSSTGGKVRIRLNASGTFLIHYDSTSSDPTLAFSLSAPTVLHLSADVATHEALSFPVDLGFTKITAGSPASDTPIASLSLDVSFKSPHANGTAQAGRITAYDLVNTALTDYATVTRGGSVNASLTLDTDLTTALTPDLTLAVSDSSLADGFQPQFAANGGTAGPSLSTAISSLPLADFTNVSPTQVLSGLGQLAASLQAVQSAANVHLPLLQSGLADTLKVVDSMVAALAQQTVTCGPTAGNPPTGSLFGLAAGTTIYCQATTTDAVNAGTIAWTAVGGTATAVSHTSGASADNTIGTVPSVSAEFTTVTDNVPPVIIANYKTGTPFVVKGVSQPVPTAQDLLNLLVQNAGFTTSTSITGHLPTSLAYNPTTHALTFHLLKDIATGTPNTKAAVDFGDRFKDKTGLVGVSSARDADGNPTSTVTVNAGHAIVDLTFGVILTKNLTDISPHSTPPNILDRFFVQVTPGVHPFSIKDATVSVVTHLAGQVGFLQVTADPPASGSNFAVTPLDTNNPILSLDVIPTGGTGLFSVTTDGGTIANALPISELLTHLTDHVSLTPNIKLVGGIGVAAKVGSNTLGSGDVSFDWNIPSMTELTSASGFHVTASSAFSDSLQKFWEMAKDSPQALLQVVLDQLSALATQAATAAGDSGSVFDTQLPLVGVTPRSLLKQFGRLKDAVDEIKGGALAGTIGCTKNGTTASADTAVAGDTVSCTATSTSAATSVQWKAYAGASDIAVGISHPGDITNVGPTPTAANGFTFTVPPSVTGLASIANVGGFRVHVDFDDAAGHHTADTPTLSSPPSLQNLVTALTSKLGLPDNALLASVTPLKKPGGVAAVPTLKLALNYDLCTTGNTVLPGCASGGAGNAIPAIQVPLSVNLGALGGSGDHPLATQGLVGVEVNGHAQLDVGFPLDSLSAPEILGTTGASLQAAVSGDNLGFQASLGPLSLQLGHTAPNPAGTAASGTGKFRLSGKVSVGETGAQPDQGYSLSDFITGLHAGFTNADGATSCGSFDKDYSDDTPTPPATTDPTPPVDVNGVVCGLVDLGLNDTYIGSLGLKWSSFDAAPEVLYPDDLLSRIASAAFSPDFLLKALPALLEQLRSTLSNASGSVKLPVVGDALDAGADIVGGFKTGFVDPVVNGLTAAIGAVGTPKDMHDKVQTFMFTNIGPAGVNLLLDNNHNGTVEAADVLFKVLCSTATPNVTTDCSASTDAGDMLKIVDASFDFQIGQGIGSDPVTEPATCTGASPAATCATPTNLPFDIGLDGVPLRIQGALSPHVGWRMRLNFGLSRNDGPYLVVNHGTGTTKSNDIELGAGIGLGDATTTCADSDQTYLDSHVSNSEFGKYNNKRCLKGTLGFLEVTVRDANGASGPSDTKHKRTGVDLITGLRVTGAGPFNSKLTLTNITSIGAEFTINVNAQVNAFVRAGITGAGPGFPSIAGTFHVGYTWGAGSAKVPLNAASRTLTGPTFNNLHIDAGQLLANYLKPIISQVQSVTSPLKPIIDTLQAPIPVVSQLAALAGGDPVTLIDLAEKASGADLSVIKSVIAVIKFINSFNFDDPDVKGLLIPLGNDAANGGGGSFGVASTKLDAPQPSSATAQSSVVNAQKADISSAVKGAAAPPLADGRKATFGVPGLDIPWFSDPSQLFKLLMGQDITLIDYQFGGLHATAGFQYTFGPFLVGPVPISIFIGGSIDINGHLGIGYDTTGLREVIEGGGPDKLLDGLFFDTHQNGHEVPVIQLVGTVTAGAQVDLVIVKAGIEAGLQLTVNFFWDDPTPDGKMGLHDISGKLDNPICLFRVSGSLDAFIKAFVEIDLFFYSDRFEFTILQLHLLDFSAACSPPSPEPATLDGTVLRINVGARADQRHFHYDPTKATDANDEQNKESVVVRSVAPAGSHVVSVTLFGFYKEYSGVNSISADGGIGNDKITLAQGSRTDGTTVVTPGSPPVTRPCTVVNPCNDVPFDLPAEIHGGSGDDVIVGGDGADKLDGDGGSSPTPAGSDKVSGGGGADTIVGGPGGSDNLSGDLGTDHVYGGTLADLNSTSSAYTGGTGPVVIQGGPGGDYLYGSDNSDQIDGGPGLDPAVATPAQAGSVDGGDHIYGFQGNDSLNGGPGDDYISGDEDLETDTGCVQPGIAPAHIDADHHQTSNDDVIDAGAGNDHVWAGSGHDAVKGGAGSNFLCGNGGDDTMEGNPAAGSTADHSTIAGGPDQDILSSGPGDSLIVGGSGNDKTTPGAGNDIVIGGTGRDTVSGGAGNDIELGDDGTVDGKDAPTLTALSPSALGTLISGLQGQSLLVRAGHVTGSTGSDDGDAQNCITAYDQLDTVTGNADCITGSGGEDIVYAGPGQDNVSGDDGNDYLDGGSGNDYMRGSQLDDYLYGQSGDDQLFGDSGADHVFGGDDRDTIRGGSENDYLEGNDSADTINGDAGADNIIGGSSTKQKADSPFVIGAAHLGDVVLGGEDDDVIIGDNGTIVGAGRVVTIFDNNEAAAAGYWNDDTLSGNEGVDRIYGGGGSDTVHGNELGDYLEGNAGADTIFGDDGADHILGGSHQDSSTAFDAGDAIRGGLGDDIIIGDNGTINDDGTTDMAVTPAGTFGDDVVHGDDGYDQVYGQLGADTLDGNAGPDYLVGDLGAITPAVDPQVWPGGSPHKNVLLLAPQEGDADHVYGGAGDDHVYGGVGDDVLQGNSGDDYVEGNNGRDSLYGLNDGLTAGDTVLSLDVFNAGPLGEGDEDDLLGGSSLVNPESPQQDVGETVMQGGLDADVMLGDNGEIVRTPATPTTWAVDPITGGAKREVTLRYANLASCGVSCGGDTMQGNEGNDRMYGEGGNDLLNGNDGQDYLEGNQNEDNSSVTAGQYGDVLFGDLGEDDLIGGSSQTGGCAASAASPCGEPDAGDSLNGGDDADVLAGDNAVVTKVVASATGDKLTQRAGMTAQRLISLLDLGDNPSPGTYGGDRIKGDDGVDVAFGQHGNDRINGNDGDDYAEGGPGVDLVQGDSGDDDLVGGSRDVFSGTGDATQGQLDGGDVVSGGNGDDLITGDNAVMNRIDTPSKYLFRIGSSGALETQRALTLLDLKWSNGFLGDPTREVRGSDQLSGGAGVDVIFGQDGNDQISGGAGDDYAEGNAGHDTEYGDRTLGEVGIAPIAPNPAWPGPVSTDPGNVSALNGQDDLIGGSSTSKFRDTPDDIHGDGGSDYELGDNGVIVRDILSGTTKVTTVAQAAGLTGLVNAVYAARYPTLSATVTSYPLGAAYVRHGEGGTATRFCTSDSSFPGYCEPVLAGGGDNLWGDSGDDTLYGQDGADHLYGDTGRQAKPDTGSNAVVDDGGLLTTPAVDATNDDDLYGELGNDSLWGESGEDAILGDRGGLRDVWQDGSHLYSYAGSQVPKVEYQGLVKGQVIRVADLLHDVNGADFLGSGATGLMTYPGLNVGGDDRIHGGTDHDSIHAGFGDDLANGDSGGDWVFGDDGADVMWGGKGCDDTLGATGNPAICYPNNVFDPAPHNAAGETQPLVTDYLIGGKGGTSKASLAGASGSDILDWRPRGTYSNGNGCTTNSWPVDVVVKKATSSLDPCSWFEMTNTTNDTAPVVVGQPGYTAYLDTTVDNQHHQGVDWQYGGWDRDILQGDQADNGPNEGDRLLDWNGAYNLYTHCNSAYGGFNDVRAHSPSWQSFLQNWLYTQGAGQSLSDATTSGTSAFVELALVYPGSDNAHGAGQAYPGTPGHFDDPNACGL